MKKLVLAAALAASAVAIQAKEIVETALATGSFKTLATASGVTVNGAKVIKADGKASNGVIHIIDTVLLPK